MGLTTGRTARRFESHTKDVLSVAFSADNRQIVSGSRDKTIKLWNTLAQCKYTILEDGHSDWVSCVRFSPNNNNPIIVSSGWDKMVKVWNLTNCKLKTNHYGHQAISTLLPSHQMVLSALVAERTARLCYGTLMTADTCIPWTTQIQSMHSASLQTDTGSVPLLGLPLGSGTWRVRTWLTS